MNKLNLEKFEKTKYSFVHIFELLIILAVIKHELGHYVDTHLKFIKPSKEDDDDTERHLLPDEVVKKNTAMNKKSTISVTSFKTPGINVIPPIEEELKENSDVEVSSIKIEEFSDEG